MNKQSLISHNKSYLPLLKEFISFKSVSTDRQYKDEILKTVSWLKDKFKENGFKVEIIKGYGNPLVLANIVIDRNLPTALVYGHYDVQPAHKSDGWKSDPFKVYDDSERLYARGVVDNKGQVLIHIATVFELIKKNKLKFNVKFIIEGDEETGSPNIEEFFKENKLKLKSDFVVISDGELTGIHPCLDNSFRGIVNTTLTIKTSNKDNHSGLYGGSIPNAAKELTNIISNFHDKEGNLTIEGINNLKTFEKELLENNRNIPYSKKEFLNITGVSKRFNEEKHDFYTQTGFLTSAEVTTLSSGYLSEGYRNAVPGTATAKINFRLAPDLTVKGFIKIFKKYLKKVVPEHVNYEVVFDQFSDGFFVDTENEIAKKAKSILNETHNTQVYDRPCGAIIPIVGLFIKYLNTPLVSIGLVNEDCNMHGANENLKKDVLKKGLAFSENFFSK